MSALLTNLAPWHWLLAAVVLMIAETLLPGSLLLWFGTGAAVTAALLWLMPAFPWQAQWLCFALVSIASIYIVRRYRDRHPEQNSHPTLNQRGQSYVGRRYTLTEPIADGVGKLHVDDSSWKVSGENLPAGTHVRVVGVDGTVLKVARDDGA